MSSPAWQVFKVQRPLATNEPVPHYMIYNESRSLELRMPVGQVEELDALTADNPRVFIRARLIAAGTGLEIADPVIDLGGW